QARRQRLRRQLALLVGAVQARTEPPIHVDRLRRHRPDRTTPSHLARPPRPAPPPPSPSAAPRPTARLIRTRVRVPPPRRHRDSGRGIPLPDLLPKLHLRHCTLPSTRFDASTLPDTSTDVNITGSMVAIHAS